MNMLPFASREAANTYGMYIVKENIQDNLYNYTKFLLLRKNNKIQEKLQTNENTKYTLAIRFSNGYKSLIETIQLISLSNGDLINLLGRPIINTKWEELFFLDLKFFSFVDYQKFLKNITPYVLEVKQLGIYQEGNVVNS